MTGSRAGALEYPNTIYYDVEAFWPTAVTEISPDQQATYIAIKFDPDTGFAYIPVPIEPLHSDSPLLLRGHHLRAYLDAHGALARLGQANPAAYGLIPHPVPHYQTRTLLQNEHTRLRARMDFDTHLGDEVSAPAGLHKAWTHTGYGWFAPHDSPESPGTVYLRPTTHAGDLSEDGWEIHRVGIHESEPRLSAAWHETQKLNEYLSAVASGTADKYYRAYERAMILPLGGERRIPVRYVYEDNEDFDTDRTAAATWNPTAAIPGATTDTLIVSAATDAGLKVSGSGGNHRPRSYSANQVINTPYAFDRVVPLPNPMTDVCRRITFGPQVAKKRISLFVKNLHARIAEHPELHIIATDKGDWRVVVITGSPEHVINHPDAYWLPTDINKNQHAQVPSENL